MATKPQFIEIDPNALQKTAIDYNTQFYNQSDKYYRDTTGNLLPARDFNIENAYQNLTGVQDPAINSAITSAGLPGVNLGNNYQEAKNLGAKGTGILSLRDRNRNYFAKLFAANPKRSFGLNQQDYLNTVIANSGGHAAFDQAIANAAAQQANINAQNNANTISAIGSTIGGVANTASRYGPAISNTASYYAPSNYLNPGNYYTPSTPYYNPGFAPSSYGGTYEGTINNLPVYRAEPVSSGYTSTAAGGSNGI